MNGARILTGGRIATAIGTAAGTGALIAQQAKREGKSAGELLLPQATILATSAAIGVANLFIKSSTLLRTTMWGRPAPIVGVTLGVTGAAMGGIAVGATTGAIVGSSK